MAKIKRTDSGRWWPVHGRTGKVLRKGVKRGGYKTKQAARRKAAEVAQRNGAEISPSDVEVYDK
jgi:hypothetical protein